jgi:hypothetical protein
MLQMMSSHVAVKILSATVAFGATLTACGRPVSSSSSTPLEIIGRPIRIDAEHKLLSWAPDAPFATVARLAWRTLETKFPVQDNGLETWLAYSRFDPVTFEGVAWPHNPAGLYAMLVDSALLWYQFSGDRAAVDVARKAVDHQIEHGSTPADWDWARVPYASSGAGDVDYEGADDAWCDYCGRGDGIGVIEPDKVGELGFAYLQMFELTADARYRDAAVACADALAKHVRSGDERSSPWPFRVHARTNVVREAYSSNVIGALKLFDELARLSIGDLDTYARARALAYDWLMRVPMMNDAWSGYFEDIEIHPHPWANLNQYSALATARWLLSHRDLDPDWEEQVAHLVDWAIRLFGRDTPNERGVQWGATVMSEQSADMAKMGSHTARLGATLALFSEATGDRAMRDRAERSLNWATYACRDDGVVAVSQNSDEGYWFSDGYGDYIRHFLVAMAAVPEWAPAGENHILRTTSVVVNVTYGPARVAWTTFDPDSTETLSLSRRPISIRLGAEALRPVTAPDGEGYRLSSLADGGFVLRVRHRTPGQVVVTTRPSVHRREGAR